MLKIGKIACGAALAAGCFVAWGTGAELKARESGQIVSPRQATNAAADEETKELLALMDADNTGKVSKREFLRFMGTEFDRLDKDKSGELDVRELIQSRIQVKPYSFAIAGK